MINKLIIDTLKPLNVPVAFQIYSGSESTYITFFEYLEQGEAFADDCEESTGYYIQVDIWSKGDYSTLNTQLINILQNAGFMRISSQDLYEPDTGIYHRGIRFFYLKNKEE